MGCDILTNESCSNQLSILSELRSFREFLKLFNYDDIIHDLEEKVINEKTFIYGDPAPEDNFKTLKGIQDYVYTLEEKVDTWINTIAGENGEIDWDALIDDSDNPSENHDIIKNSTSLVDALVKINNYLNTLTDSALFDIKVNGESVIQQDENGLMSANIPTIDDATATIGTSNPEQQESVNVNITEEGSIRKLNFVFNNIKGKKGDTGLKGETGPQGVTSVYNPTTQEFLTQLETTTGLSQTTVMTQKAVSDELVKASMWSETAKTIPSPSGASDLRHINRSTRKWLSQTGEHSGIRFAVTPGKTYRIVGNNNYAGRYAFLYDNTNTNGTDALFAENCQLETIGVGESKYITAPVNTESQKDGNYLYVERSYVSSGTAITTKPLALYLIEFTHDHISELDSILNSIDESIESIQNSLQNVVDPLTGDVLLLENSLGLSTTKTMTQKSITDEINEDRTWTLTELTIPSPSGASDLKPITRDTLLWATLDGNKSGVIKSIVPGETYRINGSDLKAGRYAFLYSNSRNTGEEPDWAENCTLETIPQGNFIDVTSPVNTQSGKDGNYLYLEKESGNVSTKPKNLYLVEYTKKHITKIELDKEESNNRISAIESAIYERADFIPEYLTVTPSDSDTYNVTILPNASPDNIFRQIDDYQKRLAFFPKVRIAGGGVLRFNMSGLIGVSVNELPWRDFNLAPNSAHYKNTELIQRTFFSAEELTVELTLNKNTKRIIILTNEGSQKVSVSSITNYISDVSVPVATISGFTFGTDEENDDKEMTLIRHAVTKPPSSGNLPYFRLLHYSDIHASTLASESILKAISKYGSLVNDVLCTGDVVYTTINGSNNGSEWWPNSGLPSKSLFTTGNHDDLLSTTTYEREDKEWTHDLYFANYIEDLGYIMPDGYDDPNSPNYKACFWYKDYESQKVRLIGLDCRNKFNGVVNPETGEITVPDTNTSNEQELWLINRLNETLYNSGSEAAGYSVIITGHYPLDGFNGDNSVNNTEGGRIINYKTKEASNWSLYNYTVLETAASMRWANSNNVNNIANIINYWIENSYEPILNTTGKDPRFEGWFERSGTEGAYKYTQSSDRTSLSGKTYYSGAKFVAYICGHTHKNLFFYPNRYPNILNVCIEMAGNLREQHYSDKMSMGKFVANILSFDTTGNYLKVVRLGVKSDVYLTPLNYLCYDYINRKVVQEG